LNMQNSIWILRISPIRTLPPSVVAKVITSGQTTLGYGVLATPMVESAAYSLKAVLGEAG
jgi:hypothetical protein